MHYDHLGVGPADRRDRLARMHRHGVAQIERSTMPLYGLPAAWDGERMTGDASFEGGVEFGAGQDPVVERYEAITLLHVGQVNVAVQSSSRPMSTRPDVLRELCPAGRERDWSVEVDGDPADVVAIVRDDMTVARWRNDAVTVTITAVGWPLDTPLALVRIVDLSPYHRGRLHALERRSGLRLGGG